MVLKDKQIFAIRRILESSSSPQAVERLGKMLKDNGETDPESIQQYLQLLTKQAIDPLCLLLGQLESGKWRRIICDRLAELSQTDVQPLTRYLSDPESIRGPSYPLCPRKDRAALDAEIPGPFE